MFWFHNYFSALVVLIAEAIQVATIKGSKIHVFHGCYLLGCVEGGTLKDNWIWIVDRNEISCTI